MLKAFTRGPLLRQTLLRAAFTLRATPSVTAKSSWGQCEPRFYFSSQSNPQQQELASIIESPDSTKIRNIAIIAHVDHGKTTLVDSLLRMSGVGIGDQECVMDSNLLEREKGITILSKCTSVVYKHHRINIVDTPGHHDFGGEVERIMSMVDGVCLLICSTEGPMTQSKFVLKKALEHKLKPIVIINKVDRPSSRVKDVLNEVFELFCDLNCPDDLLNYPVFYASGKNGWAIKNLDDQRVGVECVLQSIIDQVPAPKVADNVKHFSMLISQTEPNNYYGKMVLGRINSGSTEIGKRLFSFDQDGKSVEVGKVSRIVRRFGLSQLEMNKAFQGDIVSIAGFANTGVTHTLVDQGHHMVIPSIKIDPPMMAISINVNTSPLAGKQGDKLTLNDIKNRVIEETENDVALVIETGRNKTNAITIRGRGDLHLGVLMEKMRRQGFQMSITPPEILFKTDPKTQEMLEPVEKIEIQIHADHANNLIEKMNNRRAVYICSSDIGDNRSRYEFIGPTRGLIGLRTQLLNQTQGTALLKTSFYEYSKYLGPMKKNNKGAIVSMNEGVATPYALKDIQKFGTLFIKPGSKVYNGMVIGQNLKEDDVEVNPTKEKKTTNVRTHSHDQKVVLVPQRVFTIEDAIVYVRDDELIEITPREIRIRKKELDRSGRDRVRRQKRSELKKFGV